jgi:hypothetical protein
MRWLFGIALLWSVWAIGIAQVVAEPVDVASWLDDPKVEYVPNELIVGVDLEKGVALAQVAMEFVGTVQDYNASIGAYVVRLAPHISMKDAYEFLRNLPGVSYVEPNYIYHAIATPQRPLLCSAVGFAEDSGELGMGPLDAARGGVCCHHRHRGRL